MHRNRTNANLLYQTLLIVNVLDWWINSPDSFAYTTTAKYPYRTDSNETPVFSVPLRKDVNDLFNRNLKTVKPGFIFRFQCFAEGNSLSGHCVF